MTHGYPDFGVNVFALSQFDQDNAELAARLGSPYSILRSGHVLRIDDFEDGVVKWYTALGGTATVTSSTSYPYSGTKTMKMKDGNVAGESALAMIRVPLVRLGVYSFDFLWKPVPATADAMGLFNISINYYKRTDWYAGDVSINPNTGQISILAFIGGVGVPTIIEPGLGSFIDAAGYVTHHYVHFSIDISTGTYKSLIVDDRVYDLSGYNLYYGAAAITPGLEFQLYSVSNGHEHENYIDNAVFVIDEQ